MIIYLVRVLQAVNKRALFLVYNITGSILGFDLNLFYLYHYLKQISA